MTLGTGESDWQRQIWCERRLPRSCAVPGPSVIFQNWWERSAQVPFPAELRLQAAAARYEGEAGAASGGYFVGVRRAHAAAGLLRRCGPPGRG